MFLLLIVFSIKIPFLTELLKMKKVDMRLYDFGK